MELPKIKINDFEGPFDLLLHLIKKNQMNIYNVKIFEITNQYLNYLNNMKEMDLEITSEFIVVAATLIEIKSKYLLPKVKQEEEEEDDEKILIEKLILYKKIKGVSGYFKDKYLYNIYNNLLEIYNNKQNKANVIQRKIYVDKYKIEDKLEYIRKRIQDENINDFSELIKESECKMETVVTFLALLEMIKQRMIKVYQSDNFGRIIIERREEHAEKESNTNSIYG